MRKNVAHSLLVACLLAGLSASVVLADLGLQQIFSDQGLSQVGQTVKAAVEGIYASTNDKDSIKSQIKNILNEATETGNEDIVRYTIVAVMQAGGVSNLDLSREAINDSNAFEKFPALLAFTVSAADSLISAGADSKKSGAGKTEGGGKKEQGGAKEEQGGGKEQGGGNENNPFDQGSGSDIKDNDVVPTPI